MGKKRNVVSSGEESDISENDASEESEIASDSASCSGNSNDSNNESSSSSDEPKKKEKKEKKSLKPAVKKAKKESPKKKSINWKNADGGGFITLLFNTKQVSVKNFKGKVFVDIRDYYEKDGKLLPTKKGISLNTSDWNCLKDLIEVIDDKLSEM